MDIAEKLRLAVKELPEGDHTRGLNAIVRHVEAAIRHYDRADKANDEDAYTDCIYRTNQVYEGSLKEAYRILSGSDPSKKSLYDVEKYFDTNKNVRSRVLTQMTRYREDYRNPSTHDYNLDFDENEAVLAILSVSAFAKLLVTQMKAKIESDALKNDPNFEIEAKLQVKSATLVDFAEELVTGLHRFLNSKSESADLVSREPLALVTAFLEKSGFDLTRDVYFQSDRGSFEWDMIVANKSGFKVPVEVKTSRGRYSASIAASRIDQVRDYAIAGGFTHCLLVEGAGRGEDYTRQKIISSDQVTVYRIGRAMDDFETLTVFDDDRI